MAIAPRDRTGHLARLRIERMRPRHVARVQDIERQVYPRPWSPSLFRTEVRGEDRVYLVARNGRRIVGYAGVLFAVGEAHVTTVAVDPARQGEGIGTRLVGELLAAARAEGAFAATLEVRASNDAARRLYERFGFVDAGLRPRYYADNGEDARIMWLHDLDGRVAARRIAGELVAAGAPVPASLRQE